MGLGGWGAVSHRALGTLRVGWGPQLCHPQAPCHSSSSLPGEKRSAREQTGGRRKIRLVSCQVGEPPTDTPGVAPALWPNPHHLTLLSLGHAVASCGHRSRGASVGAGPHLRPGYTIYSESRQFPDWPLSPTSPNLWMGGQWASISL